MKKLLALPLLAFGLASCTVVVGSEPGRTTTSVSTGVTVRFGVPVSNEITYFAPNRGTGATYRPGESISFRVDVRRSGYVTLAILNPEGVLQDYGTLRNIPVTAGQNTIPRTVGLSAATPYGRSYIRAYFTTTPSPTYRFEGRITPADWDVRGRVYFSNVPENARDVAETYLNVAP